METVSTKDIIVIGTIEDSIFLCVDYADAGKENPKCLKFDAPNQQFFIEELQKFLKFAAYDEVENKPDIQRAMRGWIFRTVDDEVILNGLTALLGEKEK